MCSSHKNRFKKLILFKKTQYLIIKLYIYKKTIVEYMHMYIYIYIYIYIYNFFRI